MPRQWWAQLPISGVGFPHLSVLVFFLRCNPVPIILVKKGRTLPLLALYAAVCPYFPVFYDGDEFAELECPEIVKNIEKKLDKASFREVPEKKICAHGLWMLTPLSNQGLQPLWSCDKLMQYKFWNVVNSTISNGIQLRCITPDPLVDLGTGEIDPVRRILERH